GRRLQERRADVAAPAAGREQLRGLLQQPLALPRRGQRDMPGFRLGAEHRAVLSTVWRGPDAPTVSVGQGATGRDRLGQSQGATAAFRDGLYGAMSTSSIGPAAAVRIR